MRKLLLCFAFLWLTVSFAQELKFQPPWNTPPKSAIEFKVEGIDNVPDLYGDIENPQLVVFFAGNQFMVIDDLITAFKEKYPEYERVFVETLPPGILAKQIEGGSLTMGNLRITHKPDIYTAGKGRIDDSDSLFSDRIMYTKNDLTLMVPEGNPKNIKELKDLANPEVRISMPNPDWEGIATPIMASYEKAGGKELLNTIMEDKVKDESTYLTKMHHRQSPLRILNGMADVAPVWKSEVVFQKYKGHPVDEVSIPDDLNSTVEYHAGLLKKAPHQKAGKDFLKFLESDQAKEVYKKYGFDTDF